MKIVQAGENSLKAFTTVEMKLLVIKILELPDELK